MSEETVDGISDEILRQAETYIKELLKNKRLPSSVRAQLEIQSYFLMFLVNNHERLNQMYPYYKRQREKQEQWQKIWDKTQWVVIPILITGLFAFISQFIYFWIVLAPSLISLVNK